MTRILPAFTALVFAGDALAYGGDSNKPCVTVYIDHRAMMPIGALSTAQVVAQAMFASANVDLKWRSGRPKFGPGEQDIVVQITSNTPAELHPGALAWARPFDGVHIRIFYDRVAKMGDANLAPRVLAHVMVHEITHILEGLDRHSEKGVMKAHWSDEDITHMAGEPLPFDPSDIELIRLGLSRRPAKLDTGASAGSTGAPPDGCRSTLGK